MASSKPKIERWARRLGLLAGLAAAAIAVAGWRVPARDGRLGLDLAVAFQPTAQLELSPSGSVLTASGMEAGDERSGELAMRNLTGTTLAVRVRALPSIHDLDRVLHVRVTGAGTSLYDGTLGGLASRSRALVIQSGRTASVRFEAHLPADAADGWRGRIDKIVLEPVVTPVGG
jgi:hypothetical protein